MSGFATTGNELFNRRFVKNYSVIHPEMNSEQVVLH